MQKGKPVGGRARWYDSKGNIYEWDCQHGKLEKFDKSGKKHLGEYDPVTGWKQNLQSLDEQQKG
ncbi:colicin E3/pyocin S6 family cytotoxin [Rhizobium sp. BK251]|uniref:colicin E3/pyocin S6 family cytotoxin n=1 Tax=Rhizobium sp. BK251 TaxID=2512125 RepID=UPI001FDEDBCA|nr:colicin E3/pyocin S6 family cytotoxin [Rhizobium sp. BK251]